MGNVLVMARMVRSDEDDEPDVLDEALFSEIDIEIEIGLPVPETVSLPLFKPQTRAECASVPRPCPFVSCRYNLYLDVRNDGVLRFNFPDREPHEMVASCALDLASDGPRTLDTIAGLMGMSKERARQLERTGLMQVRDQFDPDDVD